MYTELSVCQGSTQKFTYGDILLRSPRHKPTGCFFVMFFLNCAFYLDSAKDVHGAGQPAVSWRRLPAAADSRSRRVRHRIQVSSALGPSWRRRQVRHQPHQQWREGRWGRIHCGAQRSRHTGAAEARQHREGKRHASLNWTIYVILSWLVSWFLDQL